MEGIKSPHRSPGLSPNRSPIRSPNKSPNRSPSSNYGSPPHARHRSASIPVTPEALKGVRSRFLNAPGGLCALGEGASLLSVGTGTEGSKGHSAPELTVDEASPGSLSPWNDDPKDYCNSLAYTVRRPQAEVLSRRFSETLTVSNETRRRRHKSNSPNHSRSVSFRAIKSKRNDFRPRGNSVPNADPLPQCRRHQIPRRDRSVSPRPSLPLENDEYYMLRQFCVTAKGSVVNKGDLYRARSNNSVASTGATSTAESLSSGCPSHSAPKKVLMMGTVGVGKTSLVTQFMSSEYMNYDGSLDV